VAAGALGVACQVPAQPAEWGRGVTRGWEHPARGCGRSSPACTVRASRAVAVSGGARVGSGAGGCGWAGCRRARARHSGAGGAGVGGGAGAHHLCQRGDRLHRRPDRHPGHATGAGTRSACGPCRRRTAGPQEPPSELPSTVVDERWRPFPLQVLKAPFHEECAGVVPAGCRSSGRRIGVARLAEEPVAVPTPRALQPNPGCQEPARYAPVCVLDYPAHGRSLTACDRG
jgi:hypothetical protein